MNETPAPWPCQVLFAERDGDVVTLDLVALAACPFDGTDVPSGTPFAIRLHCETNTTLGLVDEWQRDGRVVTTREVQLHDQRWLHVSDRGRCLVMQLTSP